MSRETPSQPPPGERGGGQSILRGAAWMVAFRLMDRGLGLISTIILAHLLRPADFGLVAMAMSIIVLLQMMGAFGFENALIQKANPERRHYDTAWTYGLGFGIAYAVFLNLLAVPAAHFYHEARLADVMRVLAIGSLATGLANIGTVDFRKSMTFDKEFWFLFGKRVLAFVVTMALAFTLRDYWALVIGMVTGSVAAAVLSYMVHPYRPRLSLAGGKDLFHFSKWLFISNMIQFIRDRSTDFLLGKFSGAAVLGTYNIAMEVGRLPSTELSAPINRAAYPGYSRVAGDPERLEAEFFKTIGFIMLLVLPAGVGLFVVAEPAVRVLLGLKWMGTVPLIRIIALSGVVIVMQSNMILVFFALGKPRIISYLEAGTTAAYLPFLVWASIRYGAIGAAWTVLGLALLTMPLMNLLFFRITGIGLGGFLRALWRPLVAASIMAVVVEELGSLHFSHGLNGNLESLGLMLSAGAVAYGVCIWALWLVAGRPDGAETVIVGEVRERLMGICAE